MHTSACPVATTTAGRVQGDVEDGIHVFKGIRYGADTAPRRFQPPAKPAPWDGVADATGSGNQCPQVAAPGTISLFRSWVNRMADSEDCLFLNVWTPGVGDGRKRPVMVWYHGGGFSSGSGSSNGYDGVRLARRGDVVVITVNYRLNLFGHLYLAKAGGEKYTDSGNVGMLDIVQSLEWVRDNVAAFGGDPDNVLVFGESGGGAKVTTLMTMPSARGLFHKAVVQSGAWLKFIQPDTAAAGTSALLDEIGLDGNHIDDILTVPVERLQKAAMALARRGVLVAGGPVVDGRNLTRDFLGGTAPEVCAGVPLLIGLNRTESTLLIGARDPATFELDWSTLPDKLAPYLRGMGVADVIARYRKLHPGFSASDVFFAATTDSHFLRGHVAEADLKAEQHGAPVYFYMLDWNTPVEGGRWRAPHALDIGLVFDNVAKSESMVGSGAEAQRLADLMSEAWIAFARSGNPGNRLLPDWPAYDTKDRAAMVFNVEPKLVHDVHGEERSWFEALKMGPTG